MTLQYEASCRNSDKLFAEQILIYRQPLFSVSSTKVLKGFFNNKFSIYMQG